MMSAPNQAAVTKPSAAAKFLSRPIAIVAVALVAALIKTGIALLSMGSNDVIAFYKFAKAIDTRGLSWIYSHSILFNHPPLVGYLLRELAWLDRQPFLQLNGLTFPFLLRFPGIIADFGVVLLVLGIVRKLPELRPPQWALLLFAASPVSIMITGFHGNTDPILVFFLVLASYMAVSRRPLPCGLFLAIACQVKIIPLLLLPIFLCFWWERQRVISFLGSFTFSTIVFCAEVLVNVPVALAKNVLSYGSFWGIWGVTSLLRMTGWEQFSKVSFFNLSSTQRMIMLVLKIAVALGVLVLAWRRRKLADPALFATIGYAWMIFFVFAPGVAAQYLVWLAPFILLLSPNFYGVLVAGSSIFLFALYTITSGGFPWYFAHASNKLNLICAQWAVVPWLTLVGGLVALIWRSRRDREFRFLSLRAMEPEVRA